MPRLWLINQFANTPDLPGHTRQFEVAAGLVREGVNTAVCAFRVFGVLSVLPVFAGTGYGCRRTATTIGSASSTC